MKQYIMLIVFALLICSCNNKADEANQVECNPIAIVEPTAQYAPQAQTQQSEETITPAIETQHSKFQRPKHFNK